MYKLLTLLSFIVATNAALASDFSSSQLAAPDSAKGIFHGNIEKGSEIDGVTCNGVSLCTITYQRVISANGQKQPITSTLLCNPAFADLVKKFVTDYTDIEGQRVTLFSALDKNGNMQLVGVETRQGVYFTNIVSQ